MNPPSLITPLDVFTGLLSKAPQAEVGGSASLSSAQVRSPTYPTAADVLERTAAELDQRQREVIEMHECDPLTQQPSISQHGPAPPRRRNGNQEDLEVVDEVSADSGA